MVAKAQPYGSSGEMRERITIQDQTATIDTDGSQTTAWANIATTPTVWARLSAKDSKEELIGGRSQAHRDWDVFIRYRSDLTTKMRIVWRGRYLSVKGIINPDERMRYTRLECSEMNLVG